VHANKALVRRPSPRLAEGLLTHIERSSVDAISAAKQWEGYVRTFVDAGWRVTEVEPAPECPDSVFVEDTVVVYGDLAVIARSGAVERRSETSGTEKAVAELFQLCWLGCPSQTELKVCLTYIGECKDRNEAFEDMKAGTVARSVIVHDHG